MKINDSLLPLLLDHMSESLGEEEDEDEADEAEQRKLKEMERRETALKMDENYYEIAAVVTSEGLND